MKKKDIEIANYCASFIDILGQQEEYKNEGFLPNINESEKKEAFLLKFRSSIGAIDALQRDASNMLEAAGDPQKTIRHTLPPEQQAVYDEFHRVRPKQQRWSDGLVLFVSLMEKDVKCPMNGVFELFSHVGCLCFLGLARRIPLRGSIDAAWGVELHENELYGAIVANSYELESKIAQYPRIVVGNRVVEYLESNYAKTAQDYYSQYNKELAGLCLKLLAVDTDGYHVLHYLGEGYKSFVSQDRHSILYDKALKFVTEEFERHRQAQNTKLAFRYASLLSYFSAHPAENGNAQTANQADGKLLG